MGDRFPFLGEFEHNNRIFVVTEDCYGEVPMRQSREDRIRGAKYIAITKSDKALTDVEALDRPSFVDADPIERFIGNILIFDANNLAHRCRHVYNLSNNGLDVSVTYGFLNVMAAVMRKYAPICVVVCWDGGVPEFRYKRVPTYKANRNHSSDDTYQDFVRQLKELSSTLPILGVASVRTEGCEADDLMYSATRMLHSDYRKVVISSDKDLYQCIRYDTIISSPTVEREITVDNFKEEIGIEISDYLVYRCMVGDSSDGIPGIPGIGEKTALRLIEDYGASPSNLLNVANSKNSEAKPMSDATAIKLREFGLTGFEDTMTTIRLDYDRCGARISLLGQFEDWQSYNHKQVKEYLMKNAFVSLMRPEFYNQFKALKSAESLLSPEIGYKLRMPVRQPVREPLEAIYGQSHN